MSQRVERVVYHAECVCGERTVTFDEDAEAWLGCGMGCPGGPVVVTRVSFVARVPELAEPDEARGDAEGAALAELVERVAEKARHLDANEFCRLVVALERALPVPAGGRRSLMSHLERIAKDPEGGEVAS